MHVISFIHYFILFIVDLFIVKEINLTAVALVDKVCQKKCFHQHTKEVDIILLEIFMKMELMEEILLCILHPLKAKIYITSTLPLEKCQLMLVLMNVSKKFQLKILFILTIFVLQYIYMLSS